MFPVYFCLVYCSFALDGVIVGVSIVFWDCLKCVVGCLRG